MHMNRNLWLLAVAQGLFLTNNVVFIAINGLVGLSLAPAGWMATLPVMGYVVGGALSTGLVARSQARWGRQVAFQLGLAVALASALLAALALWMGSFALLVTATVVAGYYSANGQLYRFAAGELAAPSQREKAVSLVLAGGLIGAIVGPNLANHTRDVLGTPFLGAYLALGYGVMNLLMAATPLAMQTCGMPFSDAALVLEWHVIGMFAPGFVTGHLIQRFGVLRIMGVGVLLNAACIAIALSGQDLHQFLVALFLLGVGWNFLFTGSTTLAMQAYRPEEKDRAQAAINFGVFATMALTSFASGALVTTQGWWWLNLGSTVPVALMGLALVALAWRQRAHTTRPARPV